LVLSSFLFSFIRFFVFSGFPFFFQLFFGLFMPLFGYFGFRCFAALCLRQVLYAPPPRHSPIFTFFSCVPTRSIPSFLRSTDLLCAYFAALCPLPGLFSCPHHVELPMYPSVYGVCLHAISFISLFFFFFLLVISPVSIGLLLGVMLGPDLWVGDANIILAFGSRRTSVGVGFLALNVKE
jgi:hypothetical protein